VSAVRPEGGAQLAVASLLDDGNGPRSLELVVGQLRLWARPAVEQAVAAGLGAGWLEQLGDGERPPVGLVPLERRPRRRDLYDLLAVPAPAGDVDQVGPGPGRDELGCLR